MFPSELLSGFNRLVLLREEHAVVRLESIDMSGEFRNGNGWMAERVADRGQRRNVDGDGDGNRSVVVAHSLLQRIHLHMRVHMQSTVSVHMIVRIDALMLTTVAILPDEQLRRLAAIRSESDFSNRSMSVMGLLLLIALHPPDDQHADDKGDDENRDDRTDQPDVARLSRPTRSRHRFRTERLREHRIRPQLSFRLLRRHETVELKMIFKD